MSALGRGPPAASRLAARSRRAPGWRGMWSERNMTAFRRAWLLLVTGFVEPVFYLFSLGVGLGALVGDVTTDGGAGDLRRVRRAGAAGASAMNGAVFDSTFNVFFKLKYPRLYDAVLATPLGPRDIAVGEITWSLLRGGLYSAVFLVVALVAGLVRSWWALLAAARRRSSSASPSGRSACSRRRSCDLAALRLRHPGDPADVPVLGDVLPAVDLPRALQWVVRGDAAVPGVALERGLMLGEVGWAARPRGLPRSCSGCSASSGRRGASSGCC